MNWKIWDQIEPLLLASGVAPLLAVVPDNRDPHLEVHPPQPQFWDRVREWAARGWTVAVHGFQHSYLTKNPGVTGLTPQSEFAGVPADEQERRLQAACDIFRQEGLASEVWIAPSHSFDSVTLRLLSRLDFKVINDGFFRYPYRALDGLIWVPQQLWTYRPAPPGIWTICFHCNAWTQDDLDAFASFLCRHHDQVTSLPSVLEKVGSKVGRARWIHSPRAASGLLRLQLKLWSLLSFPYSNPLPHSFKHGPVPS